MAHLPEYLFISDRLGFRNWNAEDFTILHAINTDPVVMEFFPALKTEEETLAFIQKMQQQFTEKGFCYFAVDKLDTNKCIGFIGLSVATFEADFTPCIDLGWRLKRGEWNKGFATEGAKRCVEFGLNELGIQHIYAIAPVVNQKSEAVMQKAGMHKVKHFNHPLLKDDERLRECVLYEIIK